MPTQVSAAAAANNAYKTLGAYVRQFDVPVDAVVTAGTDDIECLPIFAGETVLDVVIVPIGDMDSGGAALRFTVGDGTTAAKYLAAIDPGAGSGDVAFRAVAGLGSTYTADDKIVLTASTPATTAAAGTVRVIVTLQAE